MTKLLLLDDLGTLVCSASGKTFPTSYNDQTPLTGAVELVTQHIQDGWTPVIISNRGGIAAGHSTLERTVQEIHFIYSLFPGIQDCYFCPDFDGDYAYWLGLSDYAYYRSKGEPKFRKPGAGMLFLAIQKFQPSEVLMVGDLEEDRLAAAMAGVRFLCVSDWLNQSAPAERGESK